MVIERLEGRALMDGLPDLIVSELHTAPGVVLRPDAIRVSGAVKNIGAGTYPGTAKAIRFFISTAPTLGAGTDYPLGRISLGDIAPGETVTFDRFTDVPSDAPAGTYYVTAKADPGDEVTESDETNNLGATPKALVTVSDSTVPVTDTATLDKTFGTSGAARDLFATTRFTTSASIVDGQGKFLVAGARLDDGSNILLRFNADGTIDTTFGSGGLVQTTLFGGNFGTPIALQPDGKIIFIGSSTGQDDQGNLLADLGILRFNADGTPDTSFGTNGLAISDPGAAVSTSGGAYSLSISVPHSVDDFANGVKEKPTDDQPQYAKGSATKRVGITSSHSSVSSSVILDPAGRIYVCLRIGLGSDNDIGVARYLPSGALDPAWNVSGIATVDFNGLDDEGTDLALTPDGGIVVVGDSTDSGTTNGTIAVAKFTKDGVLDTKFSKGGFIVGPAGPVTSAHSVEVDTKGRVVVGGGISTGTVDDDLSSAVYVGRFTATGKRDGSFGTSGRTLTTFTGFTQNTVRDLAILGSGKIVIGANVAQDAAAIINDRSGLGILRLSANGKPDPTFGAGGKVVVFAPPVPVAPASPALQAVPFELADTAATDFVRSGQAILAVTPGGKVLALAASVNETGTQVTITAIVSDSANLIASVTGLKSSAIGGSSDVATVKLANVGSLPASGQVRVRVFTGSVGADQLGTLQQTVTILGGASRTIKVPITYPADAGTAVTLVVSDVDSPDGTVVETSAADNSGAGKNVKLTARVLDVAATKVAISRGVATATLSNAGNSPFSGSGVVRFYSSTDSVIDPAVDSLLGETAVTLALGLRKSTIAKLTLSTFSGQYIGAIFLPDTNTTDANLANNTTAKKV